MPTGQVITLSSEPLRASSETVHGPDLEPLWNVELPYDAIGLMVHGHLAWVLDRFGISRTTLKVSCAPAFPIAGTRGHASGCVRHVRSRLHRCYRACQRPTLHPAP